MPAYTPCLLSWHMSSVTRWASCTRKVTAASWPWAQLASHSTRRRSSRYAAWRGRGGGGCQTGMLCKAVGVGAGGGFRAPEVWCRPLWSTGGAMRCAMCGVGKLLRFRAAILCSEYKYGCLAIFSCMYGRMFPLSYLYLCGPVYRMVEPSCFVQSAPGGWRRDDAAR